ncbi:MAG: KH domain-containing protein [Verrucomicrobiota bacterium]
MEEFLRYVVRELVEYPDQVALKSRHEGGRLFFQLSLAESDVGRLIGKGGGTIQAVRTLLNMAAEKKGLRASLDILD